MADEIERRASSKVAPNARPAKRGRPAVASSPAAPTPKLEVPKPAPVPPKLAAPAAKPVAAPASKATAAAGSTAISKPVAAKPPAPKAAPKPAAAKAATPKPVAPPVSTAPATAAPAPAVAPQPAPAAPAAPLAAKEDKMTDTVTSFAEKAQEQTKAAFSKAGEQVRSGVEQARSVFTQAGEQGRTAMEKSRKVAEDAAEFGKGNVEAFVESARIAAQGLETLGQDAATFARARYESTAAVFQTLASVKSPTELLQIQSDYFRSTFDAVVKEASRSTEASLKLAGDVAKPLQNRLAVAADKFRAVA